ncbi:MAG: glycoside hydrolase family 32 protein, partial [Lachnospiraceae bacterium]|nr:glycoside hydrolase family 32 protein [Lachnospiraceae bacterium]
MNSLGEEIQEKIKKTESEKRERIEASPYRAVFHLMPPVGWLNDPNGLCQLHGVYHVFFQYSPFHVDGGMKAWGHATSNDLISYTYQGAPLVPDESFDKDGVYSGCAWVEEDRMHLYYTGNVKEEGEHDYIYSGRGANVIYVSSEDGVHFSEKELLLTNADYPAECTNHVRDPKIYKKDGSYYMVLGVILYGNGQGDKGAILIYRSEDLKHFSYDHTYTTEETFGYMWECPDIFELDGKEILSISPQGLETLEYRFQNIYQSGYFIKGTDEFTEWDMGFDFYAPQTFLDETGRRILIGWAGMPDADYKGRLETEEWQHLMTIPRELRYADGKILQNPIEELENYRKEEILVETGEKFSFKNISLDLTLEAKKLSGRLFISDECVVECKEDEISLSFSGESGAGRKQRKAKVTEIHKLR